MESHNSEAPHPHDLEQDVLSIYSTHVRFDTKDEPFENKGWDAWKLLADFGAVAVPLCVLGFIIALSRRSGEQVEPDTFDAWLNAVTVLASVFPILFAAIMGRTMYEAARWRLEQGVAIGTLEQIVGSRSVGAAVNTLVSLRAFNSLSALLLLVWALSPLGSQSIFRVLSSRLESRTTSIELMRFDNLHACGMAIISAFILEGNDFTTQAEDLLLGASLLASTSAKTGAMDLWGNVKIPFLPIADNSGEWRDLNDDADFETYSSLIGIPLGNVPEGNTTFSLESAYIELECLKMTGQQKGTEYSNDTIDIKWDWSDFFRDNNNDPSLIPANGSWQGSYDNDTLNVAAWDLAVNRFVDYFWVNITEQELRHKVMEFEHPELLDDQNFLDWMVDPGRFKAETNIDVEMAQLLFQLPHYLKVQCNILQRYVESRVVCERRPGSSSEQRECTVTAQRSSHASHPDERISHLSFPYVWELLNRQLRHTLPSRGRDVILEYLNDAALRCITSLTGQLDMLDHVDLNTFGRRLSQILNTYILGGQLQLGASIGMSTERRVPNTTAPAEVVTLVEVYDVSPGWITLAIVCCCMLVVAGALSVLFRHLAVGPEVLGYASTVLRDSKYMDLPPNTGRMGGLDISRMLKGERVRYGHTDLTYEGKPLLGVGLARETRSIKPARGGGKSE